MSRVLAVHAHPDDESLWTGITVAELVDRGHEVHVLTCTLGEEGEVIPWDLRHLEGAAGDPLAGHRLDELRAALGALGVTGHLLGPGRGTRYRDSGMAGSAASLHPRAFAGAPVREVADAIAEVLEAVRPDLVITYDRHGGYGHPDHIRVHDATRLAVAQLGDRDRPTLAVNLIPESWAREDRSSLAAADLPGGWEVLGEHAAHPPSVVPDDIVTHVVVAPIRLAEQKAALRAHATQVVVDGDAYALSNRVAARLAGREAYAVFEPSTGELLPGDGRWRDLEELLTVR